MEPLLISATAASVVFAIVMVVIAVRAGREHQRSVVRIEALRVLAAEAPVTAAEVPREPAAAASAAPLASTAHPFVVTVPETADHPYQVSFGRRVEP